MRRLDQFLSLNQAEVSTEPGYLLRKTQHDIASWPYSLKVRCRLCCWPGKHECE